MHNFCLRRFSCSRVTHSSPDIEILPPIPADRALMLSQLLNRTQHSLNSKDIHAIADLLHGYLAGDISSLLSEAQRLCWAGEPTAQCATPSDEIPPGNAKVTVDHLRAALLRIRPSGA
jgi:hypothetical protein